MSSVRIQEQQNIKPLKEYKQDLLIFDSKILLFCFLLAKSYGLSRLCPEIRVS